MTAFGPASTSSLILLVKCTPRNGKFGSGTGYINPFTIFLASSVNVKYSPRNGTILTSVSSFIICAILSACKPAQFIKYLAE